MESFTGTLQDGLSYEVLTNLTAWNDSLTSSYVLYTWHFAGYSSCELVTNCTESSLKLNSSPISHNHSLQLNPHKYREMIEEITIKFGIELKPIKASWKSQLYNLPFWLFHDKTTKQTLDLNVSLGTEAKLTHT